MPRKPASEKMSSVYVVCWMFLQTFQTYFCIQANSVEPDQTAPRGAVWYWSTLFAKMTFKITSRWQSRRQLLWLAVLGLIHVLHSQTKWFTCSCHLGTKSSQRLLLYVMSWNHDFATFVFGSVFIQERIQDDFWRGSTWSNYLTYSTYWDRQEWVNSVDPDQTPQNAVSNLGLRYLQLT